MFLNRTCVTRFAVSACTLLVTAAAWAQDADGPSPVAGALAKADLAIKTIIDVPAGRRTFDNTIGAIDDMIVYLRMDTDFVQFMAHVSTDAGQHVI